MEVNTKHISSHVLKISAISLVLCTHEITDILTHLMKYIWYSSQKSKYSLYIQTIQWNIGADSKHAAYRQILYSTEYVYY